jgi:hypothetical protein
MIDFPQFADRIHYKVKEIVEKTRRDIKSGKLTAPYNPEKFSYK